MSPVGSRPKKRALSYTPVVRRGIDTGVLISEGMRPSPSASHDFDPPLVPWGTSLHDQFMLPYYLQADLTDVVTALNVARKLDDPNAMVVTILCDTGERYLSKLFNDEWLKENELLDAERVTASSIA